MKQTSTAHTLLFLILLSMGLLCVILLFAAPAKTQDVRSGQHELVAQCMFACSSNADCAARYPDIQRYCADATSRYPDPALWNCLSGYPNTSWDQAFAACSNH